MPRLPSILVPIFLIASIAAAKVETWRQETPSAFSKGKKDGVVIADSGRVRLARALRPTEAIDASIVWDLARSKGVSYAATGNAGKVFRREGEGPWTLAFDSDDSQALSLVAMPDGKVFAGTGPTGQVVEVTDPKHPASRPDQDVLYIWGLAADRDGNLIAATGPTGKLWKRSKDGAWSLLLDSPHPHLLSVAIGPDGSIFAGSDGEGLVYKVSPDGKTSVVLDAPQAEVRVLSIGPDGALYAGTAGEGGPGSPSAIATQTTAGGTASPKPTAAGENVVYRIGLEGAAREIFRAKALIFAIAWQGDRMLVGTGPEGLLFEVRDLGRESAAIARLDHGQILAMTAELGGETLIGAGDPGAVLRSGSGHVAGGSLTSDVHDAKLVSRFGAVRWKADLPAGTAISMQVRSGNVGEPDGTWSAWSEPRADGAIAGAPPGRFVQYRASLSTTDPSVSPDLKSVAILYQTLNLPPEIAKIDVPDVSAGDGATRADKTTLRWDASDPNGDDLQYSLFFRKDGWPDWVRLGDSPLTERTLAWDVTSVPGGSYRIKVAASDRPSNPPGETLSRELVSEPFLVDHQGPTVAVSLKGNTASIAIKDDLTRIVRASYALDGGDWVPIFPNDGLFDSPSESISLPLPDLKPGAHVLMVRAFDAAGNVGTGDAVVKIP